MKIKEGFRMRKLGREHIVVAEGLSQVNFNKMISLNSSAAFLWESVMGKEFSADDLAALLVEQYGIDNELALHDSEAIAKAWIEAGIVEE